MKPLIFSLAFLLSGCCGYQLKIIDRDEQWQQEFQKKGLEIMKLIIKVDSLQTELSKYQKYSITDSLSKINKE